MIDDRELKLGYDMDLIRNFILTGGIKCLESQGWLLKVNRQFIM